MSRQERSQSHDRPERVLIAAFSGWSDAGSAATTVIEHLQRALRVEKLHTISSDGFVDFQMHRPQMVLNSDGSRTVEWPDSHFLGPIMRPAEDPVDLEDESARTLEGDPVTTVYLLAGVEPAHHWPQYANEVIDLIDTWDIDLVITIGAYFSDSPHSRPIITSMTSANAEVRTRFDAERSDYEGPVGISGVISHLLDEAGIPALSLWAQVPHYVHSVPSPKATLALLDKCEELLNLVIPRGELLTEATNWEENIDELADQDEEMSQYIRRLEEARDTFEGPNTTGDAIAYELEKFLRIRPDENSSNNSDD